MARAATSTAAVGTAATATTGRVGGLRGALGPTAIAAAKTAAAFAGPAALAAGLYGSARAAIDFESDFAGVRKTVDGSPEQLEAISLGFRKMSTEIPASTQELTAVGEAAGQLGVKQENVLGFSRVMVDMGNTTNLSAEQAAMAMARLANITGMPQTEFDRLGSTTVALGNNLATTEQEIVDFGLRIAGAGSQVGLTEAEILSLGGALSSVGINAEAGGTAISRVMIEIDKAVASGGEEVEQFAEIAGVSAQKFADHWRKDPADALLLFVEGLGRVEKAGGNVFEVLDQMGLSEVRVRDALLRTSGASDVLRNALELGTDAWQQNNALTSEAEKRYDTTASKIEVAKNALRNLGIEIGETTLPAIGGLAEATTGALNSTTRFLDEIENKGLMVFPGFRARINDTTGGLEFFRNSSLEAERSTKRLANSTDAAKGRFDAVAAALGPADRGVDEYGDTAAGTAGQVAELTDEQKQLQTALGNFADPMQTYNRLLADKEEAERKAAEATAASTKSSKDSWEDYAGDANLSIGEVIKGLRRQVKAQEEWEKNLVKIARRGRADIAKELAALGPEGADLVAEFAGATDKEFRVAARLWLKQTSQGGEDVARSLDEKLDKAAANADRGSKNVTDRMSQRIAGGVERWRREVEKVPPHMRGEMDDTERNADRGAKDTADRMTQRISGGVDRWRRNVSQIPPHMRATMRTARDRGSAGAENTADAMNTKIAGGLARWARKVDGYANSLGRGLNPVLVRVGGKKVPINSAAARTYIAKIRADGGIDDPRPQAHITRRPMVLYGEPETQGEAYIPFARSKRPRSRMIAHETVRRLGGDVQWFAKGGFNSPGDVPKVPDGDGTAIGRTARAAMGHTRKATVDWLNENLAPDIPAGGPGNWKKMWAAVHGRFPGISLHSAFRPGAITATGNRSYHGMGRAIDISPWMKAFNWIRDNYAATELIFSPAGGRQEWHGRPHMYSGITRAMHWDHIHWAMRFGGILGDQVASKLGPLVGAPAAAGADLDLLASARTFDSGGLLQPGSTLASNNTGQSEIVAAQGMIREEVSKGITEAFTGRLPTLQIKLDRKLRNMTTKEWDAQVRRWELAWEFGITSTKERLVQLRRQMSRTLPWSDEWVELFRERQQIVQDLLDDAVAGVEAALADQAAAFDDLNGLLDERSDVMQRIGDAQLAFEERRSELIEQRRDSLLSAMAPEQRAERVWANSIAAVTRNVQAQVEDFAAWAEGLDLLRSMGLSEDAVAALGLEDFTAESLATVQLWSNATQGEVDALNAAIAARQKSASDQATSEADRMLGGIGDQLLTLTRETAAEIASLQGELADIGMDSGRGYAQALAEGLSSGIPGIVDAARAAQTAIADVNAAQSGLREARTIARAEPAAGTATSTQRAPLGRLYSTPDVGWWVRFSGPPVQWGKVHRSALPTARKLWGPQAAFPNNRPQGWGDGSLYDLLGANWQQRYTLPHTAPLSHTTAKFAAGGIVTGPTYFGLGGGLGLMGEAGLERATTITPLTRDVTTPHEKRMEAHSQRMEAHSKRIADGIRDALDRGDMTVVLDTGALAGAVTKRQRSDIKRERVAGGRAAWGRG